MHGWLTIQSLADELTWKKRYFVLKDNHLFLYRVRIPCVCVCACILNTYFASDRQGQRQRG